MFTIARTIFWIILFIVGFLILEKFPRISKLNRRYILGTVILLAVFSFIVPVENAFVTFSSPQSAYSYTYSDKVRLVVEGEDTALVIGEGRKGDVYGIVPKSDTGWKLPMAFGTKLIIDKITSDEVIFQVCRYKDSEEYYITVFNSNGAAADVTDNRNSKFYHLDKSNIARDETFYSYYAYVHGLDDEYTLIVNGEAIPVE